MYSIYSYRDPRLEALPHVCQGLDCWMPHSKTHPTAHLVRAARALEIPWSISGPSRRDVSRGDSHFPLSLDGI